MATSSVQHVDLNILPGLDIQSTIQKILDLKSKQVTEAQTADLQMQKEISDWGDISSSITNLTDALGVLRTYNTWNKMIVTSSNADAVQATANTSADLTEYDIQVTKLAQSHTVASSSASELGVSSSTDDLIGSILTAGESFTIEGVTFTVGADEYGVTTDGTETLTTLRNKINMAAAGMDNAVRASIIDNRLVIKRVDTGSAEIGMSDPDVLDGKVPLQDLGILAADETFVPAHVTQQAQAAQFTVNGLSVTRNSNTNLTDVIQNVTLTVRAETDGSVATLNVAHDTATPKSAIVAFIASYNEAVAKMESYSSVTLNGTDKPTAADLQGDTLIPAILTNLRRLATSTKAEFFTDADYTYNGRTGQMVSMQDVGVWTAGKENRLAVVDETRLDLTLADNFTKVQQLFQGVSTPGVGFTHGVAGDLYSYNFHLSLPLSGEIAKHIFNLESKHTDALETINKMIDDIADQEQALWAQFTTMQDAIMQMKADISWIGNTSNNNNNNN